MKIAITLNTWQVELFRKGLATAGFGVDRETTIPGFDVLVVDTTDPQRLAAVCLQLMEDSKRVLHGLN